MKLKRCLSLILLAVYLFAAGGSVFASLLCRCPDAQVSSVCACCSGCAGCHGCPCSPAGDGSRGCSDGKTSGADADLADCAASEASAASAASADCAASAASAAFADFADFAASAASCCGCGHSTEITLYTRAGSDTEKLLRGVVGTLSAALLPERLRPIDPPVACVRFAGPPVPFCKECLPCCDGLRAPPVLV